MEPHFAGGVSVRYIESSALVAAGLEGDATAIQAIRGEGLRVVSALTLAETRRTFTVSMVRGRISQAQLRSRLAWLRRFFFPYISESQGPRGIAERTIRGLAVWRRPKTAIEN